MRKWEMNIEAGASWFRPATANNVRTGFNKFELSCNLCYCVFKEIRKFPRPLGKRVIMLVLIIVAGIVWFALAGVIILAFAAAAKRPVPDSSSVFHHGECGLEFQRATARMQDDFEDHEHLLDIEAHAAAVGPIKYADGAGI